MYRIFHRISLICFVLLSFCACNLKKEGPPDLKLSVDFPKIEPDGVQVAVLKIPTVAEKRQQVLEIAAGEIGVNEHLGPNDGDRIREYRALSEFTTPVPWCALFVKWVYHTAEIPNTITAWSPSVTPASKTYYSRGITPSHIIPNAGDTFTMYYKSLGREGHTGIIEQWPTGDFCITIEGNTNGDGSREGEEVARKRRAKLLIFKVSDWISPAYG